MSPVDDPGPLTLADAAWAGVAAAFAALGRSFLCADERFRVIHASKSLDELLGPGAAKEAAGRGLEDLLGAELFGAAGALRIALTAGERREGWRAHLRLGDREHRLVSLTVAPFVADAVNACDPRVRYVLVVRPAEDDAGIALGAPIAVGGFIARSPSMSRIFGLIENLSHSEATVLIAGESGTGKEVIARAIHEHSPRRAGPFVAVNCGALPAGLLESEMFGHSRGAFTGAVRDRVGRFELASDGTLFLDEVGDLPLELQVKLLRVLQDGTFERVGENPTRVSRARVIAATHVDLPRAVREGRFREDLYYRLRVVPIDVLPLRSRREDVEPLAHAILSRVGARQGRALRFSPDALRVLLGYDWPGNVREMENVIEYAMAVCRRQTLLPEDFPHLGSVRRSVPEDAETSARPVPERPARGLEERSDPASPRSPGQAPAVRELRRILDNTRWRRSAAAKALGVSRTTLWRWMRESGLASSEDDAADDDETRRSVK